MTGDGVADPGDPDEAPVPLQIPVELDDINVVAGGGYSSPADADPTITDLRLFVGDGVALHDGGNGGLLDATCFSWISVNAGDQEISVNYTGADDGETYNASWDSNDDNNDGDLVDNDGPTNTALVKEWNRLDESCVTSSSG